MKHHKNQLQRRTNASHTVSTALCDIRKASKRIHVARSVVVCNTSYTQTHSDWMGTVVEQSRNKGIIAVKRFDLRVFIRHKQHWASEFVQPLHTPWTKWLSLLMQCIPHTHPSCTRCVFISTHGLLSLDTVICTDIHKESLIPLPGLLDHSHVPHHPFIWEGGTWWIASMSATIGQTSHRLDGIAIEPYYSMYHSCTVYTHHNCVSWHIS